jgi:Ca2+/Na+ antiporter
MNQAYPKWTLAFALFLLVNASVYIFKKPLLDIGFGLGFLLMANLILFLLGVGGFLIQLKALQSKSMNSFIRGVYVALILKIFVVIIGLASYLFITHGKINKPSLFTALGLYIIYTLIEVRQLMKTARYKSDA